MLIMMNLFNVQDSEVTYSEDVERTVEYVISLRDSDEKKQLNVKEASSFSDDKIFIVLCWECGAFIQYVTGVPQEIECSYCGAPSFIAEEVL